MANDLVKSAARALEILEVFASERRPMTATQIGGALGYPKSSLSVLLRSLLAQGYISLHPRDQTYFPTLRLTRLGDWVPSALLGSETLLPLLRQLRDATNETITLTTAHDLQMKCLHALPGTHPIALQVEEGTTFPVIGTAVGTAWLSTQDEATVRKLLERWSKGVDGRMRTTLSSLMDSIREVHDIGFARAYDQVTPDTGAIAVPIDPDGRGDPLVVAVAGLNSRIRGNEAAIIRAIRKLFPR